MMKLKTILCTLLAAATCFSLNISCSSDDDSPNTGEPAGEPGEYIIAASSDEAVYLLQTDDLTQGELSIVRDGMEVETATAWVFYGTKYAYRLVYNQGNAGTGSSYYLNSEGKLTERNIKFEVTNRFTNYGPYGKYIIMGASGATAEKEAGNDLPKYGVTFTYIDVEAQTLQTKTVVTEDMVGNGEYYTVSGFEEKDGKLYTALCPQGLSEYGVSKGYAVDDSLIEEGALSPSQYPDKVWVAIYDGIDFENPKILEDDRISYAASRYRSQFYSNIAKDASGNLYVFSSSNAKTNENALQKTTKPSGVIRIKAGEEVFDEDYYVNIEELSGGRRMFKVWHITADYFLLQMYGSTTPEAAHSGDTRMLAIFRAGTREFNWVNSGLPAKDMIGSFGTFPYFEGGKAYMPVVTLDGAQPAVYVIDPVTATATKGVSVTSAGISAVGRLTK